MHPLIAERRAEIARLCRLHKVRRLEVFGSAARGDDFNPERSDADFLVEFDPGSRPSLDTYFDLKEGLEGLLQRKVDLVQPGAVRNPYLLASINRSREIVHGT